MKDRTNRFLFLRACSLEIKRTPGPSMTQAGRRPVWSARLAPSLLNLAESSRPALTVPVRSHFPRHMLRFRRAPIIVLLRGGYNKAMRDTKTRPLLATYIHERHNRNTKRMSPSENLATFGHIYPCGVLEKELPRMKTWPLLAISYNIHHPDHAGQRSAPRHGHHPPPCPWRHDQRHLPDIPPLRARRGERDGETHAEAYGLAGVRRKPAQVLLGLPRYAARVPARYSGFAELPYVPFLPGRRNTLHATSLLT